MTRVNPQVAMTIPLVVFGRVDDAEADSLLVEWDHWLGGCGRPFGRQSFGLVIDGEILSIAVSASLRWPVAGYKRNEVVELARCASHPEHGDLTRVCLRLWRKIAAREWALRYWPVRVYISYQNAIRHTGNLYRFDGWKRVAETRGGVTGRNARRGRQHYDPKIIWAWEVAS